MEKDMEIVDLLVNMNYTAGIEKTVEKGNRQI